VSLPPSLATRTESPDHTLKVDWSSGVVFCATLTGREITRCHDAFGLGLAQSTLVAETRPAGAPATGRADPPRSPAAETAATLETTPAAVNSALQRARAVLRDRLPRDRSDWTAKPLTAAEQDTLHRFIEVHERGDAAAAKAMMCADIVATMPPSPAVYRGRPAKEELLDVAFGPNGMGEWRLLPTAANRLPAAASYLRRPGDSVFGAFKLDVLRVRGGRVAETTTFDSSLFGAFGLPEVLPEEDRNKTSNRPGTPSPTRRPGC
jgi:hypothetical protein